MEHITTYADFTQVVIEFQFRHHSSQLTSLLVINNTTLFKIGCKGISPYLQLSPARQFGYLFPQVSLTITTVFPSGSHVVSHLYVISCLLVRLLNMTFHIGVFGLLPSRISSLIFCLIWTYPHHTEPLWFGTNHLCQLSLLFEEEG